MSKRTITTELEVTVTAYGIDPEKFYPEVEITFNFVAGRPEQGPSYASGGEPAEPDEIEALNVKVITDEGLDMPPAWWLERAQDWLDDKGYDAALIIVDDDSVAERLTRIMGEPAAPAVTVTEGWQPIESAPKMKTVLLFAVTLRDNDGAACNWHMATGYYHDGWEGVCDQRNYSPWVWDGHHIPPYGHLPTHWQPLPPPPSTTPQTGSQE